MRYHSVSSPSSFWHPWKDCNSCDLLFLPFTTVSSQWNFALPNLGCRLGVLVFPNPPNSDMNYGIFNVCTDVNACDCTRGCTDTRKRVCTESWLWEEKSLAAPGNRTCVSGVTVRCSNQLSYIFTLLGRLHVHLPYNTKFISFILGEYNFANEYYRLLRSSHSNRCHWFNLRFACPFALRYKAF